MLIEIFWNANIGRVAFLLEGFARLINRILQNLPHIVAAQELSRLPAKCKFHILTATDMLQNAFVFGRLLYN